MSTLRPLVLASALAATGFLGACSSMGSATTMTPFDQGALPDAVKVPAGHRVALETAAAGEITYQCRAKADAPGGHEWFFVGPKADLMARSGAKLGTYYGPPATWASNDGSAVTGTQVAVAPAGAGNIPAQLVKANPASGAGAMSGVAYIQRVATQGGVAPSAACNAMSVGRQEVVRYRADYIFWKAA